LPRAIYGSSDVGFDFRVAEQNASVSLILLYRYNTDANENWVSRGEVKLGKFSVLAGTVVLFGLMFAAPALGQRTGGNQTDTPTANQIIDQEAARVARLKADLRLTSEQESDWDKFEKAMREIAKRRADHMVAAQAEKSAGANKPPPTLIEVMQRSAESMRKQADDIKNTADAAEPLYGKLSADQKKVFNAYFSRASEKRP
jgi:hypothetical protein